MKYFLILILLTLFTHSQSIQIDEWKTLTQSQDCYSAQISPNNKFIAYGLTNGEIRIIYLKNNKTHLILKGHKSKIEKIIFHPKKPYIFSASKDQSIIVWNLKNANKKILGKHENIISMAISPNGKSLLTHSLRTFKIWSTTNYELELESNLDIARASCFSPDGKRFAVSNNKKILIKGTSLGITEQVIDAHQNIIEKLCFSNNGKWIVSSGWDKKCHVWEVSTGKKISSFYSSNFATNLFFSLKNSLIIYTNINEIALFNIQTNTSTILKRFHSCQSFDISSNYRFLVGTSRNKIKLWTIRARKDQKSNILDKLKKPELEEQKPKLEEEKTFHLDLKFNEIKYNVNYDFQKNYANSKKLKVFTEFPEYKGTASSFCYNKSETILASGKQKGNIDIFSLLNEEKITTLEGHQDRVNAVAFHPNDKYIASAGEDLDVKIWDMQSQAEIGILSHKSPVTSVDFSYNGAFLITGQRNSSVNIYDLKTNKLVRMFDTDGSISKILSHPKKNIFASLAANKITIYDIKNKVSVTTIKDLHHYRNFCFSKEKFIGVTSNEIHIFNINSWQKEQTLQLKNVRAIQANYSGNTLVTYNHRKFKFWSLDTLRELDISSPEIGANEIGISPSLQYLAKSSLNQLKVYSMKGAPSRLGSHVKNTKDLFDAQDNSPKKKNSLHKGILVMPITINRKQSNIGSYLSMISMFHATYLPEQILDISLSKVESIFNQYQIFQSKVASKDPYLQRDIKAFFVTQNIVSGNITETSRFYDVTLNFRSVLNKKTYSKKFPKNKIYIIPLWVASRIHQFLGISLTKKQKSFFKRIPYKSYGDFLTVADNYVGQFSLSQTISDERWNKILNRNPKAVFYLSAFVRDNFLDISKPKILEYEKRFKSHSYIREVKKINSLWFENYREVADMSIAMIEKTPQLIGEYRDAMNSLRKLNLWDEQVQLLQHFKKNNGSLYWYYYLLGDFYIDYAWYARGSDWGYKVSQQQFALFKDRLKKAKEALTKAYNYNIHQSQAPLKMLTVCMGLGLPKSEMEKWFKRSIKGNKYNSEPFWRKMEYLKPKWHGSPEELLIFAENIINTIPTYSKVRFVAKNIVEEVYQENNKEHIWPISKKIYQEYLKHYPNDFAYLIPYTVEAIVVKKYKLAAEQFVRIDQSKYLDQFLGKIKYRKSPKVDFFFAVTDEYLKQNKIVKAQKYLLKGLHRRPRSWKHHNLYADLLTQQKKYVEASEHYRLVTNNPATKDERLHASSHLEKIEHAYNEKPLPTPRLSGRKLYIIGTREFMIYKHKMKICKEAIEKAYAIKVEIIPERLKLSMKDYSYNKTYKISPWYDRFLQQFGKLEMDRVAQHVGVENKRTIHSDEEIVKFLLQQEPEGRKIWDQIDTNYLNFFHALHVINRARKIYKERLLHPRNIGLLIITGENVGIYTNKSIFAYGNDRVGILSWSKTTKPESEFKERLSKQALYAVARILDLKPTTTPTCPLSYATSVEELDEQDTQLSKESRRNLNKRYQEIKSSK